MSRSVRKSKNVESYSSKYGKQVCSDRLRTDEDIPSGKSYKKFEYGSPVEKRGFSSDYINNLESTNKRKYHKFIGK